MEDLQIVDLYFQCDEAAISKTTVKYGLFYKNIEINIFSIAADAEECVNDTSMEIYTTMATE